MTTDQSCVILFFSTECTGYQIHEWWKLTRLLEVFLDFVHVFD